MNVLQRMLNSMLHEKLSIENLGLRVIEKRLAELDIRLTKGQRAELRAKLRRSNADGLSLTLDDGQIPPRFRAGSDQAEQPITFDLGDCEHIIDDVTEQFSQQISAAIPKMMDEISPILLKSCRDQAWAQLRSSRRCRNRFESNLTRIWGEALDLLELLIGIATEAGSDFNDEFRPDACRRKDYVFDVLTRLHARACQVASEVLTLLRAGFSDGAHARWRCLHEIAAVAFFVAGEGNDVAERYLLHEAIESYRATQQYQDRCKLLGCQPLTRKQLDHLRAARESLVHRFGESYGNEYGWAAHALGKGRVTFRDIEEKAGMNHMRPYYKLASHNVHAEPKGALFRLGLYPESSTILLAGPSDFGHADPGQGAGLSLCQATIALLTTNPNLDRLVICDVLSRLERETGSAFQRAQESFEQRLANSEEAKPLARRSPPRPNDAAT